MVIKEDRLSFKLRSNPEQKDSITYEVKTYVFDERLLEEWIVHMRIFKKIVRGQNISGAEWQFVMLKCLLKGKALTDFELFHEELLDAEKA